jgi:hypothetical protein
MSPLYHSTTDDRLIEGKDTPRFIGFVAQGDRGFDLEMLRNSR